MVKRRNTHRAQLSPQWQVDFKLWGMKGEMGDEVRKSRVPYCLYVQNQKNSSSKPWIEFRILCFERKRFSLLIYRQ